MKIHHLNCATLCPLGGNLMSGMTSEVGPANLVCHVLLIEGPQGLILVDTGLGIDDVLKPQERINPVFRNMLRPRLDFNETAFSQIKLLGFNPLDVRHIILTHLDFDHAGGIGDFPNAMIHVMESERQAALKRDNLISRLRYSPNQLTQAKHWSTYQIEGERWYGFQCVTDLVGLPPEILFVPLTGHSAGHAGVAIKTDQGWLLHAGDAYFYRGELNEQYYSPFGQRTFQKVMEANRDLRLINHGRLRYLANNHASEVRIFSSHDPIEYLELRDGEIKHLFSEQSRPYSKKEDRPSIGLN